MMLDILLQLLKSMISSMHIVQWLKTMIEAKFKKAGVKADKTKSPKQVNGTVLLNQCFCIVLSYPTLKIFKKYSEMKQ